jgi:hypothetical protein
MESTVVAHLLYLLMPSTHVKYSISEIAGASWVASHMLC